MLEKDLKRRKAIKSFISDWQNRGYERGESQSFWQALLRDVLGVAQPEHLITFEERVHADNIKYIDGFIHSTRVLIEQKSRGVDLRKPIRQSDGSLLSPYMQARNYALNLPLSQHPRWIVTCNFEEILIYDMENPNAEPEQILVKDLEKEAYRLQFMVDVEDDHIKKEMEISMKAGALVGKLYDAILKQYHDPESEDALKSLNQLCVRLVFCLYAEDAGIFNIHNQFRNYINAFSAPQLRSAIIALFDTLNTPDANRDPYLDEQLKAFPYVNGNLFEESHLEIPQFNDEIRDLLLHNASEAFDWSEISPTIFGAVFESTLNPETRRAGGMHYTSIENIHKVIDPLFLDDLSHQLEEIKELPLGLPRNHKIEQFKKKLGSLTFLDPAAGSGNFLTETYLSLRRLENEALSLYYMGKKHVEGQTMFGDEDIVPIDINPIEVSINQFYGIEINDFAVAVAKTAMWIAESQMMKQTEDIIKMPLDFLPLKTYVNIVEANALRIDWESVVPKEKLNYIMGNPPFVGARLMTEQQKADLFFVFGDKWKNAGNLDYVSCWYKKATDLMQNTGVRAALVSTNSVSQGEQVATLWKPLFEDGVHIDFAHRTFRWDSEASIKAHVHCVIVGFSCSANLKEKVIFSSERPIIAKNINAYLIDAPSVFVDSIKKPICDVPVVVFGNMPNDSGFLSDFSQDTKDSIVLKYPEASIAFKRFLGATEFINNKVRWCLWLKDVSPSIIRKVTPINQAVASVKEMREKSTREATKKLAETPMLFGEIRQPETDYIIIPRHSSENRKYVPIGFVTPDIICGDANLLMPNASIYQFGVLTSNIHNAWIRAVCGRIKSDFRYSVNIVYNNFPWPTPTEEQKVKIEQTAQAILDARAKYPEASLADMYGDKMYLYTDLLKAHQDNDRAVMQAYGFDVKTMTESSCVAELMKLYQKLTKERNN